MNYRKTPKISSNTKIKLCGLNFMGDLLQFEYKFGKWKYFEKNAFD